MLVEDRPGADGIIGVAAYANMRDDHALLFSFAAPISVYPATRETLPYDPKRDLVPIASASDTFGALAVSAALKTESLADFVARARAQPGKLNCYPAAGAFPYVLAGFAKSLGLAITAVPYREQTPAVQDLSEGRLDCLLSTITAFLPAVQSGKARIVAVTNSKRAPIAPDVPTAIEAGFPGLHFEGLVGLFGHGNTPPERRDRIAADVRAVAAEPAIADRLAAIGQIAHGGTPTEFAVAIEEQRAQIASIVKATGLAPGR